MKEARFSRNPSKGSSPVSTERRCPDAAARRCRNPSKGSSPVSTMGVGETTDNTSRVAIPRKVPRRFPPQHAVGGRKMGEGRNPSKGSSPVSTRETKSRSSSTFRCRNPSKGSSPVSTRTQCTILSSVVGVAIPRKVPRRFPQLQHRRCIPRERSRNPSKGSSPVSTGGFRAPPDGGPGVAIPRKVPRRFPRKG